MDRYWVKRPFVTHGSRGMHLEGKTPLYCAFTWAAAWEYVLTLPGSVYYINQDKITIKSL